MGCRKDAPDEPPVVRITYPAEGSTLSIPDTVDVTVHVEDDIRVERVSVTLVNASGVAVAPGVEVAAAGATDLQLRLPLTSELLESGNYRLMAAANDGSNTSYFYRPVQLSAAPLRLRSVYIVSSNGSSTTLQRVDSIGQITTANTWPMDLGGAAVDMPSATVFVAGGVSGPLLALAMDGQTVRWQQPNLGTLGLPYFTSLDRLSDGRLYVGRSDAYLRGFRPSDGSSLFSAPLDGIRTEMTIRMGDLLVGAVRTINTPERRIVLHQSSSGVVAGQQPLALEPVALYQRTENELLIFGNDGSEGVLEARDITTGATWEPRVWPSPITCTVRVGAQTWLVALSDGTLERFDWNGSGSLPIASGAALVDMAFDPANATVIAASDAEVKVIDPNSGSTIALWPAGPGVKRVLPLLNR